MIDPTKAFWDDVLDVVEKDNTVDQEHISLDEIRDEELKDSTYVEGIDNWEEWN